MNVETLSACKLPKYKVNAPNGKLWTNRGCWCIFLIKIVGLLVILCKSSEGEMCKCSLNANDF